MIDLQLLPGSRSLAVWEDIVFCLREHCMWCMCWSWYSRRLNKCWLLSCQCLGYPGPAECEPPRVWLCEFAGFARSDADCINSKILEHGVSQMHWQSGDHQKVRAPCTWKSTKKGFVLVEHTCCNAALHLPLPWHATVTPTSALTQPIARIDCNH